MIIEISPTRQFRDAEDSDVNWLYRCLYDFPGGGWAIKQRVRDWVDRSQLIADDHLDQDPIKGFDSLVLIYESTAGNRIGCLMLSYYAPGDNGPTSGVAIHYAAVHPNDRGKGEFTELSDGIVWFCNQFLEADEGYYKILPDAPQVATRAVARGGSIIKHKANEYDEGDDVVNLRKSQVAASLSAQEKNKGKIKKRDGSQINKKARPG